MYPIQPKWRDNHLLFGYDVVADLIHIFDVVRQRHCLQQANSKGQVDSRSSVDANVEIGGKN